MCSSFKGAARVVPAKRLVRKVAYVRGATNKKLAALPSTVLVSYESFFVIVCTGGPFMRLGGVPVWTQGPNSRTGMQPSIWIHEEYMWTTGCH